ncbi:MAG: glycosyltransferase family 2 protein, partial [Methanomicrobiales archaeon]
IILILLVVGFFLIINTLYTLFVIFTIANITYFVMNPVKIFIAIKGFTGPKEGVRVSKEDIDNIDESKLPVYTILVPMYREKNMLPHILKNIHSLDYPKNKLDVKLLMEEEDEETLGEARSLGLFGSIEKIIEPMNEAEYREFLKIFDPVIIPKAEIRTKPRACTYGLYRAKGEYVVIYDAEDYPEPDQLKKSVIAFRNIGSDYACLQCLLNYYNPRVNILTRWFTIEYSYYYDYFLKGMDKIGAAIPLGGTSNHFRVKQIREIGAWDPYNVTEDADLGVRIARRNLKTGMLDSHTYEESVSTVRGWINQRARWVKGFIITWLVHMRHPRILFKELGLKRFVIFQLTFGGNFYMPLMNVLLWSVFIVAILVPESNASWFSFLPFAYLAIFNLIVGNLTYVFLLLYATYKERQYDSLPLVFLSPIYWILMSIGAWKGLIQLIRNPHFWDKTAHGTELATGRSEGPDQEVKKLTRISVEVPTFRKGMSKPTFVQVLTSVVLAVILIFGVLMLPIYFHIPVKMDQPVPGPTNATQDQVPAKILKFPEIVLISNFIDKQLNFTNSIKQEISLHTTGNNPAASSFPLNTAHGWKFRADPNNPWTCDNGGIRLKNKVKWTFTTGYMGQSSPAVADAVIYIRGQDGRVYKINVYTGHVGLSFFDRFYGFNQPRCPRWGCLYRSPHGQVVWVSWMGLRCR